MRFLLFLLFPLFVLAETAPPTFVKAKLFDSTGTYGLGSIADALKVNLTNTNIPVTGTFWQATQPVSIAAPVAVTGSFYQATQPVSIASPVPVTGPLTETQLRSTPVAVSGALTNTELRAVPVPISGTVATGGLTDTQLRATPLAVTVTGAGDASQTLQTAGNNTLIAINSKIPAPLSVVNNKLLVDGSGVVQPINGAVSVINPSFVVTGPVTDTQLRAAPVPVTGSININSLGTLATAAKQDTGNTSLASIDSKLIGVLAQDRATATSPSSIRISDGSVFIDPRLVQVTSSVLPTGASTGASQATGNASLGSIDTKLTTTTNGLKVDVISTSGLTDTQLRATPVPVTGIVTTGGLTDTQLRATAVPVSNASLPLPAGASTEATLSALNSKVTAVNTGAVTVAASALPSGAATSSAQASIQTTLNSIDTKTPPIGQALMAASAPVTIASNQSTIPVSTGLAQGLTDTQLRATAVPVSNASLPLPAGASTLAAQTSGNSSLSSIDSKITAVNTGAVVVASSALPSGASTETTLSAINVKTPALGQALAAGSSPVVLTAAQLTTLTPLSSVAVSNFPATQNVSGTVTANTGLAQPVTDTQLRATPVVVSGTIVTGGLTDTQLRAVAVPISVSGTPNVAVTSSALPAGASTSANQTTTNASLNSIDVKTPALGQALAGASTPVVLTAAQIATLTPFSTVAVSNIPAIQAVSQSGAFTVSQATGANLHTVVDSGSVTATISGTPNVAVTSSTLPTGGSTSSLQTTGNTSLGSIDTKLTTTINGLKVDGSAVTQPVSIAGTIATTALTDTQLRATAVPVSNASLPLPSGASTSSAQSTGNASLASIDTKTPALGQALAAGSTPVVLTVAQLSTLTPLTSVSVNNFPASQVVTGTFFQATQPVSLATTPGLTDTQLRATPVAISGTVAANSTLSAETTKVIGTVNVSAGQSITANIGTTNGLALDSTVAKDASLTTLNASVNTLLKPASTLAAVTTLGSVTNTVTVKADTLANQANALKVDATATTQPVSIAGTVAVSAATLPLPSGAATSANQTITNASVSSIDSKTAALVTGRVPVDGSAVTQPISASTLPLPSGASTSANQTISNGSLSSIDSKTPVLGQTLMATSQPVTIASNQSAIPVTGTFYQATQPISVATLPLPAGSATSANQTTELSTLATIAANTAITTVTQPTGSNLHTVIDSGAVTANIGTTNGLALDASVNTLLKPASTLAAVTNLSQLNGAPISMNTGIRDAGTLRVSIATNDIVPVSQSSVPWITAGASAAGVAPLYNPVSISGIDAAGLKRSFRTDSLGNLLTSIVDGTKRTYSAATGTFTIAANSTDVLTITGSATATVKVNKLSLSCTQTTGSYQDLFLVKRSTANSAGTSTTLASVPLDSNNVATTATVRSYTANPTLGTSLGNLRATKVAVATAALTSTGGNNSTNINLNEFAWAAENSSQAFILRGVSQVLSLNFNGQTMAGASCTGYIEYLEE